MLDDYRILSAGLPGDPADFVQTSFPLDVEYVEEEINVVRVVEDGDTVSMSSHNLTVIRTPGHSAQHVALYHPQSGILFSADLVLEYGHFSWGPLDSDIEAYRELLSRIRT